MGMSLQSISQGWTQRASCPFGAFSPAFYFSHGNKIYVAKPIATGNDSVYYYNQITDSWHSYGVFPGAAKTGMAAAVYGNEAFVFCGSVCSGSLSASCPTKEVWKLNLVTNIWTQLPNFPGTERYGHGAVLNTNNNKIYISFGRSFLPPVNTPPSSLTDFWEFNPITYQYAQKASFSNAMSGRYAHCTYAVGNRVFVAWGSNDNPMMFTFGDTPSYDIITNTWSNSFGTNLRSNACVFNIAGKVYGGMGGLQSSNFQQFSDFFNIVPGTFTTPAFPGVPCQAALSIDCGGRGYIGLGFNSGGISPPSTNISLNQLWEFTPSLNVSNDNVSLTFNTPATLSPLANDAGAAISTMSVLTGPQNGSYTINNLLGTISYTPNFNYIGLDSIQYVVCDIQTPTPSCQTAWIYINVSSVLSITPTNTSTCLGTSVNLIASGMSTYTWLPMMVNTASVTVTPTATTIYTVIGQSPIGISTKTVSVNVLAVPNLTYSTQPTLLCAGKSVTFTATGATSYTWMNTNFTSLTNTFIILPNISQILSNPFTLTGMLSNGCKSVIVFTVNVSPSPTIIVNTSPSLTCVGQTVTLTASGANTYTWHSFGNASGNTIAFPITSVTTVSVSGTNSVGCIGNQAFSIAPNAVNIAITPSSASICVGNSVALTASGANTYTWLPSGATTNSLIDYPVSTTVYSIAGQSLAGCTKTQTIAIVVNSTPTISILAQPNSLCIGNSTTLSASGATNYTWSPVNLFSQSIAVSPTTTTTYTLTGENVFGCSSIVLKTLTVFPSPNVLASATSSGGTSTLSCTGLTNATWNPGGFSGVTITVSPLSTTTYTVLGNDANGCSGQNTVTVFSTTNVESIASSETNYLIYPTLTSDYLYFKSGTSPVSTIEIINNLGQIVFSDKVENNKINMSFLKNGLYYCHIILGDKSRVIQKIIKY